MAINHDKQIYKDDVKGTYQLQSEADFEQQEKNHQNFYDKLGYSSNFRVIAHDYYDIEHQYGKKMLKKFDEEFLQEDSEKIKKYKELGTEKNAAVAEFAKDHKKYSAEKREGKFRTAAEKYQEASEIYRGAHENSQLVPRANEDIKTYVVADKIKALELRREGMRYASEAKSFNTANDDFRKANIDIKIYTAELVLIEDFEDVYANFKEMEENGETRRMNREYIKLIKKTHKDLTAKKKSVRKGLENARKTYQKKNPSPQPKDRGRLEKERIRTEAENFKRYQASRITPDVFQEKLDQFYANYPNGAIRTEFSDEIKDYVVKSNMLINDKVYDGPKTKETGEKLSNFTLDGGRSLCLFALYDKEGNPISEQDKRYKKLTEDFNNANKEEKRTHFRTILKELTHCTLPSVKDVSDPKAFMNYVRQNPADFLRLRQFGHGFDDLYSADHSLVNILKEENGVFDDLHLLAVKLSDLMQYMHCIYRLNVNAIGVVPANYTEEDDDAVTQEGYRKLYQGHAILYKEYLGRYQQKLEAYRKKEVQ